jgi:hypothetical protein
MVDEGNIATRLIDFLEYTVVVAIQPRFVEAALASTRCAWDSGATDRVGIVARRPSRHIQGSVDSEGVDMACACRQTYVAAQRPRAVTSQRTARGRRRDEARTVDRKVIVEGRLVLQVVHASNAAIVAHHDAVDKVPRAIRLFRGLHKVLVVRDVGDIATGVGVAARLPRLRQRHPVEQTLVRRAVRRRQTAVVVVVAAPARQVHVHIHRQGVDVARTGMPGSGSSPALHGPSPASGPPDGTVEAKLALLMSMSSSIARLVTQRVGRRSSPPLLFTVMR